MEIMALQRNQMFSFLDLVYLLIADLSELVVYAYSVSSESVKSLVVGFDTSLSNAYLSRIQRG